MHMKKDLEWYAFAWSEVRLLIAAVALLLGGVPPILFITPSAVVGVVALLLALSWVLSGVAAAYLVYRWYLSGRKLFGASDRKDMAAFLVLAVSGINLGLVPFFSNLGMSISSNYVVFVVVAVAYVWSAYHLYRRWKAHGEKIFIGQAA